MIKSVKTTGVLATADAVARWEALFDCSAPSRLPHLMDRAIAWREQVLAHGDIAPAIAHDLQLAAEHARAQRRGEAGSPEGLDAPVPAIADRLSTIPLPAASADQVPIQRTPKPAHRARATPLPPAASQLLPGSQLIKAYGGRNHVVAVEPGGFRYEGVLFASLSAIAKHITGTHWNGLLFFGLRKRRTYPAKPRRHG
ncbi:MAG TPA: hypothetical protein DEP91_02815 [Sphingomonas bacterium]|jgi:hypothetical protein|uniref:DUF2924 domain-containing protein n=1 Tax=Sphingomonas bacterium TaxID=1895847 RepID=A0A3D0W8N0_9SPHN|nr:hypothetical protein [Sphingomonas bacterium]